MGGRAFAKIFVGWVFRHGRVLGGGLASPNKLPIGGAKKNGAVDARRYCTTDEQARRVEHGWAFRLRAWVGFISGRRPDAMHGMSLFYECTVSRLKPPNRYFSNNGWRESDGCTFEGRV